MPHTRHVGMLGERLARKYLEGEGLRIVTANFRGKRGEIDLIAREGDCLVFCEVKYRAAREFGLPEEAVTAAKQHTLRAVAEEFLARHRLRDQACRFDVVSVLREGRVLTIRHLRNAFT